MRFDLRDTGDLKRLAKDLRAASNGKELRKEFTSKARAAVRPVVPEVRAAYLAAPSEGHDTAAHARRGLPDLRALLARATRVEIRTTGRQAGIRVRVDGRRMPNRMGSLPSYWEGEEGPRGGRSRWRHPVFGDRDIWVQQRARPTFYPIMRRHTSRVAAAVNQARDEVARKLERKTL